MTAPERPTLPKPPAPLAWPNPVFQISDGSNDIVIDPTSAPSWNFTGIAFDGNVPDGLALWGPARPEALLSTVAAQQRKFG